MHWRNSSPIASLFQDTPIRPSSPGFLSRHSSVGVVPILHKPRNEPGALFAAFLNRAFKGEL
jgi:hypothetical protein